MKKSGKRIILIVLATGLFFFNSCNKDETLVPEVQNEVFKTTALDYIQLSNAFTLSTEEEITTGDENSLKSAETYDCLTVTVHENEDGAFWPRSWTLDYGTENCECYLGNTKRGKIHVTLTDWWRNEGSYREISFEDYYFNDNKMEGVKTILNTGLNENGNLTFSKKVNEAKMSYADGSEMSWNCDKTSELIEGGDSFVFADDVWSVTGSGSGVNIDGNNYTMTITSALIYQNGCFFPVSGIVEIAAEGEELKVIDYGNGECDNLATVTVGDESETIEL